MMWKMGSEISTSVGKAKLIVVAFLTSENFNAAQSFELYESEKGQCLWYSEGKRQDNLYSTFSRKEAVNGLKKFYDHPVEITFFPKQEE